MFNGLLSERDYWGHQHYLVRDDHPESQQLTIKGGGLTERWSSVHRANFSKASFINVDLSETHFHNWDFNGTVFADCNLNKSTFTDCNFTDAILTACEMEDVYFPRCNLENAELKSDISKVRFNYAYGNNRKFASRVLYNLDGRSLTFGATQHQIYIGCQRWSTEFFEINHRTIAKAKPYYYSYYNKYREEILDLLIIKGWIEEPSLLTSLLNRIPLWDL